MRKYLVTEHYEDRGGGDTTWETKEELPPGARVLTKGRVRVALAAVILGQHPESVIDELFGESEG